MLGKPHSARLGRHCPERSISATSARVLESPRHLLTLFLKICIIREAHRHHTHRPARHSPTCLFTTSPTSNMDELTKRFESLSPADRINSFLRFTGAEDDRFTQFFVRDQVKLKELKVHGPQSATGTFTFKAAPFYCNPSGNLHGGAQSTMYDICSSLVLQSIGKRGFWINAGVSRVLTVTYLRPAPEGTELEMECEVVAAGKTLAMLRAVLRRADNGAVISTCEHNKAAVPMKPSFKL